jgi:hypothetical protein
MFALLFGLPTGELLPMTAVFWEESLLSRAIIVDNKSEVLERHTSMAKKESSASALKNRRRINVIKPTRSL